MTRTLAVDVFPLCPMQQGMLFHSLQDPHAGVDIEQLVIHLPEIVDARRLKTAWEWLVRRHDILRARFVWEGVSCPQQEILSEVVVSFAVEDARQLSEGDQRERLKSFLERDRLLGFDLNCAPLLRLTLFQWQQISYSLVWTFHHALLDGRCFPILLREVFEAYAELGEGDISLRATPASYRRYVEQLQQESFDDAELFWKELLAGFSAPTPLAVGCQPTNRLVVRQGEAWETLDSETTTRLRKLGEMQGCTMNSLVMGAWAILIHRYSGEDDVVFGAARACRKAVGDADNTIGLFINTVPVRVKLSGNDTALSVFKNVRRQWLSMRPYERTPLVRVKALSQVPASQPLFETLLVFESYRLDEKMRSLGGDWSARRVELHELTNFPITLAAYDGDQLSFKIEFDHTRLDDASSRRLLGHLRHLLEDVAGNPQAIVRELGLLTETERRELLEGVNTPIRLPKSRFLPLDGGATLYSLFEAQVDRRPEAVALTCESQSLTYRQLNAQANVLAGQLLKCGLKPDTLVGVCIDRSNELVIAILAILKAGCAYLPLDLAYPADRLAFILEDAQAPVLLTQSKLIGILPSTQARVLCVDEILAQPVREDAKVNLPSVAGPDDLAYVIYTSGTTGKPKGSLITHRNVVRLFSATEHWYEFNEEDVWTLFHSCAFDFSVWEIWGALLYGGRVVVVPFMLSRSPEAFYELLVKEQVTVLNQTPSAFRQLIQAEESVGEHELALRYVIFGGEALEMQNLRPWFERHGDQKPLLINMYGITETTVHVTYRPLSKKDLTSGSAIGIPIPDLQVYVLDPQGQPAPIGVSGEIYVGGAGLARGYLHRPELTSERFVSDHITGRLGSRLYRTGDRARFLSTHDIEYLGRIDDQVKIRGFRIEPGEIESVLCQNPAVREAVVVAREDVPGIKRLVAYLVVHQPAPEMTALREHLKTKIPEYMLPTAFLFLDKLPLTASGKVDRSALPVPERDRRDLAARYVAPRTLAEKKLTAIWARVLRVEKVGVNDNFFELGGDSILSIQVISLARRQGLGLTPKQLFAHQTIAELAATAAVADDTRPVPSLPSGDVSLTPIQEWFFQQNLAEPHHYNQSFLFRVTERIDRARLESALTEVSRQHDALRLRYIKRAGSWHQFYAAFDTPQLIWMDCSHLTEVERQKSVEVIAASMQASLNLQDGPLWQAAYFDFGSDQHGRLLLVVHHLAIDGVSWSFILEDLEIAYEQLKVGGQIQFPARTSSYKRWADRLREFANTGRLLEELPFWKAVTHPERVFDAVEPFRILKDSSGNTEESARTLTISLTTEETQALLHQVPSVYNTQINDVALTALVRAWNRVSGSCVLFTNLEGHGREDLFEDVDLSRTVGWFTSIFPVRLELPHAGNDWQPGEALKAVKEQLRRIPHHGIGYGILRYLSTGVDISGGLEPPMVFNYLGQFDQVLASSKLFRFAPESTGPWHSPKQQRGHALEINSLVIDGRLELRWTYSQTQCTESSIRQLTEEFVAALRELIIHCQSQSARGYTPSDFPLARLDQSALDRLIADQRDIEDIYTLSPIQTLFFSATSGAAQTAFDQWHCTLYGTLNVPNFQRAWQETLRRHPILRSSIHGEGSREPVQVVHRDARPFWILEDWRGLTPEHQAQQWTVLLKRDSGQPLVLTEAPVMRFTLVRLADERWKFLWSIPALLLDGWSWPVVFSDASRLYECFSHDRLPEFEPARPYRDYLAWLRIQSSGKAKEFWHDALAGFNEPTPLQSQVPERYSDGDRYVEHAVELSTETTDALKTTARRLPVTINILVQAAWTLLLSHQSGNADVVFGAAFAGRPAELLGVESIVGPFVNNLPVRVIVDREATIGEFLRQLHKRFLELNPFQFVPLMEIQRSSEVPWRHRLFESLVVFQNYLVDESARRFGEQIAITDFTAPIHSNYPVVLLAVPGTELRLTLIYDRQKVARTTIEQWGRDLAILLEQMPGFLDRRVSELLAMLSPAVAAGNVRTVLKAHARSQNVVLPQTETERIIANVWQKMLGLTNLSIEENLFDLGGHSLLIVQLHSLLRETLQTEFPIVALFEHPTVHSLARFLDQTSVSASNNGEQWRERAQRQKEALAQLRAKVNKQRV